MIYFYSADIKYTINHKSKIRKTIEHICRINKNRCGDINIILCSDDYLLEINRTHLNHDYYTDIITFDFTDNKTVNGDLYISLDRIKENAKTFHVKQQEELCRVIFHGVLHLNGYKDKKKNDQIIMRTKENSALKYYNTIQ